MNLTTFPIAMIRLALALMVIVAMDPVARAGDRAPADGKVSASAAPATLGRVTFPVTGGAVARRHFVRGLLALHSFWYEEARDEFREATRAQPDFAMGRWGEALTFFQPVWGKEDVAAETKALAAVPAHPAVTPRELAYLEAARTLIADGDFASHAASYRDAMRSVHQRFPDDDEAAALYAVAILGTVNRKTPGFRAQAEAGALMLELFARNPDHPGAAHYIIHAFDDPDHARLALPAARRYAQVAPEAFHALHMPSHIFVHLGMWAEAATSNESSWAASQAWVSRKKLDASLSDFHSLSWLHAIYLELGQHRKANQVLGRGRATIAAARDDRAWLWVDYLKMVVKNAVETDDFTGIDEKVAPIVASVEGAVPVDPPAPAPASARPEAAAANATSCHPAKETDLAKAARRERGFLAVLRAERALGRRDGNGAMKATDDFAATLTNEDQRADAWRAIEGQLRGRATVLRGGLDVGLKMLTEAADLEDRWVPSGPVETSVSARERLGEVLLAAGRPRDALAAFRRALALHPRRARVLLGCARAATAAGEPTATDYWTELAAVWVHADSDTPGLDEVRRALTAGPPRALK
ncbi:MAG TPA: tetratricopeptide repeat protein [Polyangia bacterium]|nr:tetratricopeptide repeat protein [Polyangia bacterium]